ncbi:hypothetical protein ACIHFE_30535 [Streptomyces sp. NPDC052396]|uniref:hypothetical protein n=1 Tax=Streptomyces sp. NPDC052396 TaxID=3365689 RepID=UPI0037D72F8E
MTPARRGRDRDRPPACSPPSSPARKALARLRIRLTIAYTVFTVIGLGALSAVAIHTDARSRQTAELDEMKRRATVARSLICTTNGHLDFDALSDDDITDSTAVLIVLQSRPNGTLRPVFSGGHPPFHVSTPRLLPVAAWH